MGTKLVRIDYNEFAICLDRGEKWLKQQKPNKYGLTSSHLSLSKITNINPLLRKSNLGVTHVGYKFTLIRHPKGTRMVQHWIIYFDGELELEHEVPLGFRHVFHKSKLIKSSELWGKDSD